MSDWVLATEDSGYTRHFGIEALPVSIGGGQANDINLAGIRGSVQVGMLDDVFFVQPGRDAEGVRMDGELLRGSKRLADGQVIALDSARLVCRLAGNRLTLRIEAQVTAGDTAPPDFDEIARRESAEVSIAPIAFDPKANVSAGEGARKMSKASMAVAAAFTVLGVLAWFAFTAKSVAFEIDPVADEVELPDTWFQFRVGDRFLLRPGRHRVTAALAGYYPLDTNVEVSILPDQTIELQLVKLPGLISFATDADVAAEVRLDGDVIGTTPLTDVEIVPGTHQVEFVAERYLAEVLELDVEGGHVEQAVVASLTPSWARIDVTSEPLGADVVVDGRVIGQTPASLELTAGQREIELRLRGYNAWSDRLMVVADVPQTLPPVTLSLADGRIDLASTPSDASVSVNGEYRGRTPLQLRLSPGRSHAITVAKPGYETATRELSVAADSGRSLGLDLVPIYGEVDVQTEPPGAGVWVDERLVGNTPVRLELMAVPHSIEVRREGFAPERQDITPRPGYPQALMFELTMLDTGSGSGYPSLIRTSLGQELRLIPAGQFAMGTSRGQLGRRSNEVLRQVEVSSAFYLGVREVTNAEFREFMAEHDSGEYGGFTLDGDDQPVVRVRWQDVAAFLNWLSIEDGLQPVYIETPGGLATYFPLRSGYRLPTEAEWAWAARAAGRDESAVFAWGEDVRPPEDRVANLADLNAAEILPTTLLTYSDGFPVTAPVASFERNPVGIYDLGGNVAEWIQDFYEISVLPGDGVQVDPLGPEMGQLHVIRGPSWRSASLTDLRLAYRASGAEEREDVGFRIARNLGTEEELEPAE